MTVQTPPSWLQGASHPALNDRLALAGIMGVPLAAFTNGALAVGAGGGHGVVRDGDFAVSQRGAGANMSVDIAAGTAFVRGSQLTHGIYGTPNNGVENRAIAASDPTNPRNDLVIVRINDNFYVPSSGDNWDFQIVTGTPAASPVDPTVSNNYMIIARVVVPAGASSILNANITDLRTKAAALGGMRRCTSVTRPSSTMFGERIFETDTLRSYVWDGVAWRYIAGGTRVHAARASHSSTGTIAGSTTGQVSLATEQFDFGNNFASSTYTVPVTGQYYGMGRVGADLNNNPQDFMAIIRVNGADRTLGNRIRIPGGSTNDPMGSVVTDLLSLTAGDTVTLYALNGQANIINLRNGATETFLAMDKIS